MALSFVTDKMPVDVLKIPFEHLRQPLRARFDSIAMEDKLGSEQMKVFLRVRPFTENEKDRKEDQNCFVLESEHKILTQAPPDSFTFKNTMHGMGKVNHKYSFNKILGPECRQVDVFNSVVREPVKDFIEGRNSLVFTYGITSSGKTYTIQGPSHSIGILPRALDIIFSTIGKRQHDLSGVGILAPENFSDVVKLNRKEFEVVLKQKDELTGFQTNEPPDHSVRVGQSSSGEFDPVGGSNQETGDSQWSHLAQILAEANKREKDHTELDLELKEDIHFSIWVSYAEIYNECIYDLFTPLVPQKKSVSAKNNSNSLPGQSKTLRRPSLELRMDKRGSIYIRGLRCFPVSSADDAYRLLLVGRQNQQMACTKLNLTSSRSHTIFSVYAVRCAGKAQPRFARVSTISFCDLAGSERTVKTQNVGERLREAGNINTSLLTLGRCIQILRNNQVNPDRPQLVPYRESKLTRLFQSFFTGKGKACMLVNINQCASMFDETLHVLKFSALAKQIVVHQNQQPLAPIHGRTTQATTEEEARRSRYHSLGLRTPKPGKRVSIAWENTPLSCTNSSTAMSSVLFTGHDATLVDDRHEDTVVNSLAEETVMEYDTEELLSIIEDLKNQLIEAKEEIVQVETRVRDEVCREMDDLVLRLESQHEEALREQETYMQEQSDRRIQLYLNTVGKTNKRARIMKSDELDNDRNGSEEDNISVSLTLRNKIEELELEVSDLRSQCADQKEALAHVTRERDEQALAVTRLQFKAGLNDRETAQKFARNEKTIKDLSEQLQQMMSAPKDTSSHISDIDIQIDQSRLQFVSKKVPGGAAVVKQEVEAESVSNKTKVMQPPSTVKSQHAKKKVFSPVLPKRESDEITDASTQPPSAENPPTKLNVFSPVISAGENECSGFPSDVSSNASIRVYEDSSVAFNIPATPKTVVKNDSAALAKENNKLITELQKMQGELKSAMEARKAAERSLMELQQEVTSATTGVGSFLRHEAEAEMEEALDQKLKEIETLSARLKQAESSIQELEMRCVEKHDALVEQRNLANELESRCQHLENEVRRLLGDLQRERTLREAVSASEREDCENLKKKLETALTDLQAKTHSCATLHDKVSQMQSQNHKLTTRLELLETSFKKEKDVHNENLEMLRKKAQNEKSVLVSKIEALETTVTKTKQSSEENKIKIDVLKKERTTLESILNEAKQEEAAEISSLRSTLKKLNGEAEKLQLEKKKLGEEIEKLRPFESLVNVERNRVKQLEAEFKQVKSKLEEMNLQLETRKQQVIVHKSENVTLNKQITEMREALLTAELAKRTQEDVASQVASLECDIKNLRDALQRKDDDLCAVQIALNDMEKNLQRKEAELERLKTQRAEYAKEIKDKENVGPSTSIRTGRSPTHKTRSYSKAESVDDEEEVFPNPGRRVTRSMRHK